MVEQKFLGVDECPQNIFVRGRNIVLVGFDVRQRHLHLICFYRPRERRSVKFLDTFFMRPLGVSRQSLSAGSIFADLVLDFAAVKQMQSSFKSTNS